MTTTFYSDNLPTAPQETSSGDSRGIFTPVIRLLKNLAVTLQQGLPLFHREMLVQSNRSRTYVVRALFAITLFFVAIIYTAAATGSSLLTSAVRLPGQGRVILDALVWMLFAFIYVFAPATTSGVITLEKERQTLVLLFLTKLTSWHVVLEKFLSRLLPTLSILLLSMPLLVIAYTFGGVTRDMLLTSMWFLFVTAIQVTAVSVFCSTLCRYTTRAFILTYGVLILIYFGPLLVDIWLFDGSIMNTALANSGRQNPYLLNNTAFTPVQALNSSLSSTTPPSIIPDQLALLACFPPVLFAYHYEPTRVGGSFIWQTMLLAGYPALLSAIVSLLLARCFVFFRAFEDQRSPQLQRLRQSVRQFRLSYLTNAKKLAILNSVPDDDPIAWRESFRSSGTWIPALLMLEIPALSALFWLARTGNGHSDPISLMVFITWAIGIVLICVHVSSLMTKERSQQTLDLLLATPLSSAEIIQQKFNGIRRMMLICAAPVLTCIVFQAWWRDVVYLKDSTDEFGFIWWEYLITAGSCVFIYFQIAAWIALWAGLRMKSPTLATLYALGGVAVCCVVPQLIVLIPLALLIPINLILQYKLVFLMMSQLSPVLMISLAEYANLREVCALPLLPTIANSVIYLTFLYYCRRYVLDRADVLIGRKVLY